MVTARISRGPGRERIAILGLLALSLLALAIAPLQLDEGYSIIEHTTSESAAQGVDGGWVARAGFLMLGSAVFWLAVLSRRRWGLGGALLLGLFGLLMVSAAAFSSKPWQETAPYDSTEDLLHSVAASAMGLCFIIGLISVGVSRISASQRALDFFAAGAAIALSIGLLVFDDVQGLLQRLMFLVGYAWFIRETLTLRTEQGR